MTKSPPVLLTAMGTLPSDSCTNLCLSKNRISPYGWSFASIVISICEFTPMVGGVSTCSPLTTCKLSSFDVTTRTEDMLSAIVSLSSGIESSITLSWIVFTPSPGLNVMTEGNKFWKRMIAISSDAGITLCVSQQGAPAQPKRCFVDKRHMIQKTKDKCFVDKTDDSKVRANNLTTNTSWKQNLSFVVLWFILDRI